MNTPEPKSTEPLEGLADWLRGMASTVFIAQPHVADTLRRWANEVESSLKTRGGMLAKHQPCGCVICTCADEERCHGCGAKNCGNHPVGQFPNPLYASPPPETRGGIEPTSEVETFVRMLLWDDFPECCGNPTVADRGDHQEQECCGCPERVGLSDAQIVGHLRERFATPNGNTPYDEGPFTIASPPSERPAAPAQALPRELMESYLVNAQDEVFKGFDNSVQKDIFTGPHRRLFEVVYRMGFECGWRIREECTTKVGQDSAAPSGENGNG
jgi:hypothetical protein